MLSSTSIDVIAVVFFFFNIEDTNNLFDSLIVHRRVNSFHENWVIKRPNRLYCCSVYPIHSTFLGSRKFWERQRQRQNKNYTVHASDFRRQLSYANEIYGTTCPIWNFIFWRWKSWRKSIGYNINKTLDVENF